MPSHTNGLSRVRRDQLSAEGDLAGGFCQSLGHGKFGFQTRGRRCHLICGGVTTGLERKPPAWEMREEPQVRLRAGFVEHGPVEPGTPLSPSKELSHLIFPATPGGRYYSLPLFRMRKLRQRAAICEWPAQEPGWKVTQSVQSPPAHHPSSYLWWPYSHCCCSCISSSWHLGDIADAIGTQPRTLRPYLVRISWQPNFWLPASTSVFGCRSLLCPCTQWVGSARKLAFPKADDGWCINTPDPLFLWWEHSNMRVLHGCPEFLTGNKLLTATVIPGWKMHALLAFFPSLTHFPIYLTGVSWDHFPNTTFIHILVSRAPFGRSQTKIGDHASMPQLPGKCLSPS